jgi:stress response protein YsnF
MRMRRPRARGERCFPASEIATLADGSLSIPLYEEELVVTKRTVLRERLIVRKEIAARTERVEAELRREQVEIDADDEIELIDDRNEPQPEDRRAGPDPAA